MSWVPIFPPAWCELRLRQDGRFGYEDFLQWPQPAVSECAYLACIPTRGCSQETDFWHGHIFPFNCAELNDVPGVYQLNSDWMRGADEAYQYLKLAGNGFAASPQYEHLLKPLIHLHQGHSFAAERLRNMRGSIHQLQMGWVLVARYALDIYAYVDYYSLYLPRLTLNHSFPVDKSRMGAIVHTDHLAQEMFKMGLPVWHLRRKDDPRLYEVKMLNVVPWTRSQLDVSVSPMFPDVVYECDGIMGGTIAFLHEWSRAPSRRQIPTTRPASAQLPLAPTIHDPPIASTSIAPLAASNRVDPKNRKRKGTLKDGALRKPSKKQKSKTTAPAQTCE